MGSPLCSQCIQAIHLHSPEQEAWDTSYRNNEIERQKCHSTAVNRPSHNASINESKRKTMGSFQHEWRLSREGRTVGLFYLLWSSTYRLYRHKAFVRNAMYTKLLQTHLQMLKMFSRLLKVQTFKLSQFSFLSPLLFCLHSCTCTCACVCARMHVIVCACMRACVCMCVHIHTYMCKCMNFCL